MKSVERFTNRFRENLAKILYGKPELPEAHKGLSQEAKSFLTSSKKPAIDKLTSLSIFFHRDYYGLEKIDFNLLTLIAQREILKKKFRETDSLFEVLPVWKELTQWFEEQQFQLAKLNVLAVISATKQPMPDPEVNLSRVHRYFEAAKKVGVEILKPQEELDALVIHRNTNIMKEMKYTPSPSFSEKYSKTRSDSQ